MEWSFAVWVSVVVCASILSVINIVKYCDRYKSGQGIDLSVMDILIVIAGLPGTLLVVVIMLCLSGAERLAKVKVFSIGKNGKSVQE
jgi:hypothetical protein